MSVVAPAEAASPDVKSVTAKWSPEGLADTERLRETMRSAASFNRMLNAERRARLPFLDPHTSIAQTHCHLWFSPEQRLPRTSFKFFSLHDLT